MSLTLMPLLPKFATLLARAMQTLTSSQFDRASQTCKTPAPGSTRALPGLYSGSTRACSAYDMPYHNLTHFLGDCRTFGIKAFSKSGVAKFDHNEDSFCRICRLIAVAMSQKAGEK